SSSPCDSCCGLYLAYKLNFGSYLNGFTLVISQSIPL
ncbi:unnamed protein product, partial [Gulo gulo]